MESRNKALLSLALAILSVFLIPSTRGVINDTSTDADDSWDLALTIDNEIHFLYNNGTEIRHSTVSNAKWLVSLAYESGDRTLYLTNWNDESYVGSFLYSRNSAAEKLNPRPVLNRTADPGLFEEVIYSMVFDPATKTLFGINYNNSRIIKIKVSSDGSHAQPEILHDLNSDRPFSIPPYVFSIALDVCNRFIYWVTFDSIERSRLDGADREAIITGGSFDDYGSSLAIDCCGGKLYFTNIDIYFSLIEEISLDGTNRRVVTNETNLSIKPNSLAVDDTAVYWTDRRTKSLWKVSKDGTAKKQIKSYQNMTTTYVITRYSAVAEDDNCKDFLMRRKNITALKPPVGKYE